MQSIDRPIDVGLFSERVTLTFSSSEADQALVPLRKALSRKSGLAYCIVPLGDGSRLDSVCSNPTEPGFLRCPTHRLFCLDPDCALRETSTAPTFDWRHDAASLTDASRQELLCDHCRREVFYRCWAKSDDDAAADGRPREVFSVYRYRGKDGPTFGHTYDPVLRREQRCRQEAQAKDSAGPSADQSSDQRDAFHERVGTLDWLSPDFTARKSAYHLECILKHFNRLAAAPGYPQSRAAGSWRDDILSTSGHVPFEKAVVTISIKGPYASLDLAASLRLLVTLRFQARRRLSRTGFTVPPCSVRGIWTNCDGQYENVGGARCLDWTDVDKLELVFPFSELSVSELNSSVRVTGDGPGWLEDLRWLPNRFGCGSSSSAAESVSAAARQEAIGSVTAW